MSAEKCPECGAWWAWPSEHRCPPIISTNTASITAHDYNDFLRRARKPDEPSGLGAVVEDAEGRRFVHRCVCGAPSDWWASGAVSGSRGLRWSDFDAVRVLSEGVPATDLGGG